MTRTQRIAYQHEFRRLMTNPETRHSAHANRLARKLHQHGQRWFNRMLNRPDNRIPANRGGRPRRLICCRQNVRATARLLPV
jgi:hypothetical protein